MIIILLVISLSLLLLLLILIIADGYLFLLFPVNVLRIYNPGEQFRWDTNLIDHSVDLLHPC